MSQRLNNLINSFPRKLKMSIFIFVDSFALVVSIWLSFCIRLDRIYLPSTEVIWLMFMAPLLSFCVFYFFKVYKDTIRYIGLKTIWIIVKAVSIYAILWGILALYLEIWGFPRSVILINWLISIILLISWRLLLRRILSEFLNFQSSIRKNILIYGAGEAGRQISLALSNSSEYQPIAFIDDDDDKYNDSINGLEVIPPKKIEKFIAQKRITEIFITIPSLSRSQRKKILEALDAYPLRVLSLPGVDDLAKGTLEISDLHEIEINDLLGRSPVPPNLELLSKKITDLNVMVTGAGGSIGAELCRQIIALEPKSIILFEISEYALYEIEKELNEMNLDKVKIFPILGSVTNKKRLNLVINHFNVDTIYHSAAYKHVPLVEINNFEGVINNVFGTLYCVQAAIKFNVSTFVLISTDKAVRPSNTMGASKRLAEMTVQSLSKFKLKSDLEFLKNNDKSLDKEINTEFSIVRFGNVLNSSGSVIPLFKKQIKNGGPVTVTDAEIIRYFMSKDEAVALVIQAGAMGKKGEVFILDMGEPVLINDLAKKMIKLSGLQVKDESNMDGDIEIQYSGLRPGEKLYEELLIESDSVGTKHEMIMQANEPSLKWKDLSEILCSIEEIIESNNSELLRDILIKAVPEFSPQSDIVDLIFKNNN